MTRIPGVKFRQNGGRDTFQHLLGEDTQQLPTYIQRFEYGTIFVTALRDEILLELRQELQIEQIVRRQSLLPHHSLHRLHVFTNSVASILEKKIRYLDLTSSKTSLISSIISFFLREEK